MEKKDKKQPVSRFAKVTGLIKSLFKTRKRAVLTIIVLAVLLFLGYQKLNPQTKTSYQTTTVERGTLVTTISASGSVVASNSVDIGTQATGIVKKVFVKNGDTVKQGQVVATLTLDSPSQQKQAQAWASYLQAKTSLDSANTNLYTLQAQSFAANQKFINDAVARGLATNDPTYIQENATWLAAEANYNNQQGTIASSKSSLTSAYLNYQQASSNITAPITGVIAGLNITEGFPITSSSSSTSSSSQTVGSIKTEGPILAQVNLSEVDSINIKVGQKATMTADALPNKTFTGKITAVNTNGVVASGVTTYPAIITFDTSPDHIYPNMGVNGVIITNVKDNVLLVPSAAIQSQSGQSDVRVLKDGNIETVTVEVGDSSDTQTEITSGLSEGDVVVIGTVTRGSSSSGSSSPFSSTRGGFGGALRVGGGGGR